MSRKTQPKILTSTLSMSTIPHMDDCPCSDHGRHFSVTPVLKEYLEAHPRRRFQRAGSKAA